MRLAQGLSLLALAACVRENDRTIVYPCRPGRAELVGAYAATWGETGVRGLLLLEDGARFAASPCPCGTAELADLAGAWLYDEATGRLEAEGASLDGKTRGRLQLSFRTGPLAAGTFELLLLDAPCAAGTLTLEPAE